MQNPWNVPEAYIGTDGGSPRSQGSDVSLIDLDFDTLWTPVPEKNRHGATSQEAHGSLGSVELDYNMSRCTNLLGLDIDNGPSLQSELGSSRPAWPE